MKIMRDATFRNSMQMAVHLGKVYARDRIVDAYGRLPKSSIEKRNLLAQVAAEIDPTFVIPQIPARRRTADQERANEGMGEIEAGKGINIYPDCKASHE